LRELAAHPWALAVPAVVVISVGDAFEFLPLTDSVTATVEVLIGTYLYFLYLTYVEYVVHHHHAGGAFTAREATRLSGRAARAAPIVAVTGTLLLLAVAALILAAVVLVAAAAALLGPTDSVAVGVTVAVALTVVAVGVGLWFTSRSGLTVSSMVIEHRRPLAGVRRSFALTRGRTVLALTTVALALALEVVAEAVASALLESSSEHGGHWPLWICGILLESLVLMVSAVVVATAFAQLAASGPLPRRRDHVESS
jgi:hypothetical protein